MLPWQMLPGQMSLWQFKYVQDGLRNLPLKFGHNRVSNSWDIADIEFLWGGVVWFAQSFSCPTSNYIEVTLLLSWGCDNIADMDKCLQDKCCMDKCYTDKCCMDNLHGQMLHGQMLHGQMLHGQMVLGHLSTVKDGSTNLKYPPWYFP